MVTNILCFDHSIRKRREKECKRSKYLHVGHFNKNRVKKGEERTLFVVALSFLIFSFGMDGPFFWIMECTTPVITF